MLVAKIATAPRTICGSLLWIYPHNLRQCLPIEFPIPNLLTSLDIPYGCKLLLFLIHWVSLFCLFRTTATSIHDSGIEGSTDKIPDFPEVQKNNGAEADGELHVVNSSHWVLYFVSSRERPWRHWLRQRIYAARRIICASIPGFSFECWGNHMFTPVVISMLFLWNTRWRHGRSRGETKYSHFWVLVLFR